MVVLALILIHAAFPLLGAVLTRSRCGAVLGGVLVAVLSLASATPATMAAGAVGLLLGVWAGFAWIRFHQGRSGP